VGDRAAARKPYQEFLTLWKGAGPHVPFYRAAKAEHAKLASLPRMPGGQTISGIQP